MTRINITVVNLVAIATIASFVSPAAAREYPAWSDTDWIYATKRECCNGALALAQHLSVATCIATGGTPSQFHGGVQRRGFCQWESTHDEQGTIIFRCHAEASVPCR